MPNSAFDCFYRNLINKNFSITNVITAHFYCLSLHAITLSLNKLVIIAHKIGYECRYMVLALPRFYSSITYSLPSFRMSVSKAVFLYSDSSDLVRYLPTLAVNMTFFGSI